MNIGLYGGTFNPPHKGHFRVMEGIISHLALDQLLLIPTATPPHKEMPEGTPPPEYRVEMTQHLGELVAIGRKQAGKPKCHIQTSTQELDRGGISYTLDTLKEVQQQHPQATLWLIMGEDMLTTFSAWHQPEEVAKRCNICAFHRSDAPPSPQLLEEKATLEATYGATIQLIAIPQGVEISSTQIRKELAETGTSDHLISDTLGVIWLNQLYGTQKDLSNLSLQDLRCCAWSMIHGKRVPHVVGVEQEAAKLAKHWGEEEEIARISGILHDCTKYWTHQQHIDYCLAHNLALDPLELETEKLLHAKSGGCMARDLFGQNSKVVEAILCHTTGKGNMTLLDKILYLADYIEPHRDFEEVEKLRLLAYQDIDQAMTYGLEITLDEMRTRKKVIHQNTLDAAQEYGLLP